MVLDYIVVFLENLIPVSLLATQILGFGEVFQILMIHKDCERVFGIQEVLAPFLESEYDCCHFKISSVVVSLSIIQQVGDESNGVSTIALLLR